MENLFYEGLSPKDRIEALYANADKVESGTYYKQLTEEELAEKRITLSDLVENIDKLQTEKAELVKDLNERLKIEKASLRSVLTEIKTRVEEKQGDTYYFADHAQGLMSIYDSEGSLLSSRKLRPDERQKTIMEPIRQA